jgi:hypothetical protein
LETRRKETYEERHKRVFAYIFTKRKLPITIQVMTAEAIESISNLFYVFTCFSERRHSLREREKRGSGCELKDKHE